MFKKFVLLVALIKCWFNYLSNLKIMDILNITTKEVAIIVAHPDDETLWVGGTILIHPAWNCFIVSVCRRNDTNRAPKFYKALKALIDNICTSSII